MTLPVVLSPEAEEDLDEVVGWYERQSSGFGVQLIQEVREALGRIGYHPECYPELWCETESSSAILVRNLLSSGAQPHRSARDFSRPPLSSRLAKASARRLKPLSWPLHTSLRDAHSLLSTNRSCPLPP